MALTAALSGFTFQNEVSLFEAYELRMAPERIQEVTGQP